MPASADIDSIAVSAGTTLVQLMAQDAWSWVKAKAARVLGRGRSDREAAVGKDLELSRTSVVLKDGTVDDAAAERAAIRWEERFRAVMEFDETAVAQVRELLAELTEAARTASASPISVNQTVRVADHGIALTTGVGNIAVSGPLKQREAEQEAEQPPSP